MIEIPWERLADGTSAHVMGDTPEYILPVLSFLRLSEEKMTSVGLISADFHNIPISFMLRIGVHLETRTYNEFLGLYLPDDEPDPQEERPEGLPTLCLRRASWHREGDDKRFRQAASMRAYVQNEQQLEAHIVFLTAEMAPAIIHLAEEARELVQQGITLRATSRAEPRWVQIGFRFQDEIRLVLSYIALTAQNDALEDWITQWQRHFAEADYSGGILPDQGCLIGYPYGVMDFVRHFPEQSFQTWRREWRRR